MNTHEPKTLSAAWNGKRVNDIWITVIIINEDIFKLVFFEHILDETARGLVVVIITTINLTQFHQKDYICFLVIITITG